MHTFLNGGGLKPPTPLWLRHCFQTTLTWHHMGVDPSEKGTQTWNVFPKFEAGAAAQNKTSLGLYIEAKNVLARKAPTALDLAILVRPIHDWDFFCGVAKSKFHP